MTELSRDDIRALCTAQSFERGVTYYEQRRIQHLDIDDSQIRATVRGTYDYQVSIDLTDDDIWTQCNCPYDYAGDCKHIVAVLLAVSDKHEHDSVTTAADDRGTEDAVELVEQTAPATLRAFVVDVIKRDRTLRDRFVAFAGGDTGKTVYDYKREIDRRFDDATDHRGMIDYDTYIDVSHYDDLAEIYQSRGDVTTVATIYRALSETLRENLDRIDDSGGYYGRQLETAIQSYVDCLTDDGLDHEEKREYIEYLVDQYLEAEYGFVRSDYDDALRTLCTTTEDLDYWRQLVEPYVPDVSPVPAVEADSTGTSEDDDSEERNDAENKDVDQTTLRMGDLTSGPLDVTDFTGGALPISHLAVGPLEATDFVGEAFEATVTSKESTVGRVDDDQDRDTNGATLTDGPTETGTTRTPYRTRDLMSMYSHLLRELDDRDTLLGLLDEIHLEHQQFCQEYAELLIEEGRDERAIKVVVDGIETFRSTDGLRRLAVDLYRDHDPERYQEVLKQLFLTHEDWEAYDELTRVCDDDDWESIYDELVFVLEQTGSRRQLLDLYLYDGDREHALSVVVERGDLSTLQRYRNDVGDVNPDAYFEAYREQLVPFLANDTGRSHYRDVIEHLEAMRDLGLDDEFVALVEHLREKHSNRPAFLGELEKARL